MLRKKDLRFLKCGTLGLFIWLATSIQINAQVSSFELWPETDIWYKVTPSFRLSSIASISRYFESDTRDFNLTFQADYAFGNSKRFFFTRLADQNSAQNLKVWLVRGGYMGGWSLYDNAVNYNEDMFFVELHRRILMKWLILFSQRVRFDNRWLGDDPTYSYRFRYRAMFEREFLKGKTSIIPYISAEPFWDSRYDKLNRVRIIGGSTVSWKQRFALEANITYQHFSASTSPNIFAFNAILHLYFQSAKVRENSGQK